MVKFGIWSITLLIGSAHGLLMAGLLLRARSNRAANRWLAALLILVVLMITPYTIGYAGFYDAYPWLTFAPFFWQLGFGPLVYLYVRQLGDERLPDRWRWHFVPLAIQVAYYVVLFAVPLPARWHWNDTVHAPFVLPLQNGLVLISLAVYLAAAGRRYLLSQRFLAENSAAREEFRLGWLAGFLVAIAFTTLVAAGFALADTLVRPLSYFDEFPLYLVFAALVYYLGLEGWRNAARRYPRLDGAPAAPAEPPPRDWAALGERVRRAVAAGRWWSEPELELAELARRVGTNTNYLSRALNEGLHMGFSEFINRQRVEAAQRLLADGGEILDVAFEVGFRSKASFNRVFKAYAGTTPSRWRADAAAARRLDSGNGASEMRS